MITACRQHQQIRFLGFIIRNHGFLFNFGFWLSIIAAVELLYPHTPSCQAHNVSIQTANTFQWIVLLAKLHTLVITWNREILSTSKVYSTEYINYNIRVDITLGNPIPDREWTERWARTLLVVYPTLLVDYSILFIFRVAMYLFLCRK